MNNKKASCISLILGKVTIIFLFISLSSFSQSDNDSISKCPVKSLPELFKKKDSVLTIKPKSQKNSFFLIIPVIGSSPATGFLYGAVTQYTFKGKHEKDKYSSVNLGVTYTTNKQLLINVKNNVLINHNKIYFSGDWRYYIFSQDNYGLGSDIIPKRDKDFILDALAQPMDYDYFKFHQTASFRIKGDFYIGGGVHLDGYTNIVDKQLDVDNDILTDHYIYNNKYEFSTNEYYVNGFSLNLLFDSRDNQVNANNGSYANINLRVNPSFGKNQATSTVLFTEFKHYIPLSETNVQHVLAFWTYGQFLTRGNLPYLNLPAIGWDKTSRGGRGYTQGLLRGQNLAYLEAEYRFPITCNQLISGTVFTNFTTASDRDRNIKLFQYIQPAFGVGLRILIDKSTRTNLILNQAWGRHSNAFYLNAGETF
ncbi:MAG TPA: BamA/TamA family outer membrane protein [Flavobacteriaceae bacterium]|nr:BamA/TamA family outer membrane protein [Flavobacteriaceae bacterium]